MARLVIKEGENKGMSFEIRDVHFSIGRDLSNDIQLLFPKVSRIHAEISFSEGTYTVRDKGSRNGTFINGEKMSVSILKNGDLIGIGDSTLMFYHEEDGTARESTAIFGSHGSGRETVISTRPSWNVDLLKKHLLSGSQMDLQNSKLYLVELYELTRELQAVDDIRALLKTAGERIKEIVKADRIYPVLSNPSFRDGWEVIQLDEVGTATSLAKTPISRSAFERSFEEKISLVTHCDIEENPSESMINYDIHSALCVPVADKGSTGDIFAMIYADRLGGGENFTNGELEFVTAAALVISDAVRGLEKIEHLRHHEDILKKEVRSRYNIVGESRSIKETLKTVERAARSESVVLVMGESGTGKEVIARVVHYLSPRNAEVFRTINCAAISESLLESELFGHVKGAFTGADSDKPGVFELADGGTLFLDEIGEMSAAGQAKLLRVLEQGEISKVGATEVINVDVRVIAATNKDLEHEVSEGTFRADLFHRLNVVSLVLPPLRERKGDVRILLEYYADLFSSECGRRITFSEEALAVLEAYSWPGNIRELKNFVERTVIMASEDIIQPDALPGKMVFVQEGENDSMSLAAVERAHILRVLDASGGNKKKASEILGIDRSTLYAKLDSYKDTDTE